MKWGAPLGLCVTTDLIRGSRPTEGLIVHQLGNTGFVSTHCTVSLLGPQPNGPEFDILCVEHQQLLAAGSWHTKSRARLFCEKDWFSESVGIFLIWLLASHTNLSVGNLMAFYNWKQILNGRLKVRMICICKSNIFFWKKHNKLGICSDSTEPTLYPCFHYILVRQAQSIPSPP